MQSYEKLAAFYLGRTCDDTGAVQPDYLLYDAKDLTTHAVCVGMTGSGKTGLCLSLLEEAAIDGIPVLAIDPKGDLGNLMLTFPQLRGSDFEPWVDPGAAVRHGMSPPEFANHTAEVWKSGLAKWDQDGARIQRFKDACEVAIYTPGSSAGRPLTVLKSFDAPPQAILDDAEALGERVMAAVSGLLAMLGYEADPIQSREHILLSNIVSHGWKAGRNLSLGNLIREIQAPPFDKIGFFDLESFFPGGERMKFAMAVNNLAASPSFASWMQGEPLNIPNLLWTPEGKPRIAILSIAHLSDEQRMFFVTLVLNEMVSWMRTQPGTTSLRALLYMDEVFGYFPPTANPPSKLPMLTLLKQARAFGVGCVLATQNPVDLDYKGLSNTGTWFLGRLQTERDKARVLDGLEGASATAGKTFDRARTEAILSGLKSRCFLMNNVHEDAPVLFHSRWAMSYLRGPMTREQIQTLTRQQASLHPTAPSEAGPRAAAAPTPAAAAAAVDTRPVLPPEIPDFVLPAAGSVRGAAELVYRPALLGEARLHFISATDKIDEWRETRMLARLDEDNVHDPWEDAETCAFEIGDLDREGETGATFAELPAAATKAATYRTWQTRLKDTLYREHTVTVWKCNELKQVSEPGESERDFRARLALATRELRDEQIEKLRQRYAPKLSSMQDRIATAQERVERERSQYQQSTLNTALSVGSTILGALFGRKIASAGNVSRAATTARRAGRAAKEKGDIGRAEDRVEDLQQKLADLEAEFEEATEEVRASVDVDALELTSKDIRPRKSDIDIERVVLVWAPWQVSDRGSEPLYG